MVMLVIFLGTPPTLTPATTRWPSKLRCGARHLPRVRALDAGYTESVEEKNPALVATGLALWGWVLRATVGFSFVFLPSSSPA